MWVYAIGLSVGQAVDLCYRLCCGFVLSVNLLVKLWYCAIGRSVSLTSCGSVVSVRLWVCDFGQSVKMWVCSIGQAVGLCCRSVSLSGLWVCSIDQIVGLCCRSVCWSSCWSLPSNVPVLHTFRNEEAPRWSQEVPWSVNKE
jgi:hypothetical protein